MKPRSATAVLLLSCPDQRGLVAGVSDFIYRNGGNIVTAEQHTDFEKGIFLQRVEWDLEGFGVSRTEIAAAFEPVAKRFGMDWTLRFSDERERTAILVSQMDHCLHDLLWRHRAGEFEADIRLVASNHPDAESVAGSFGHPFRLFPIAEAKAEQESQLLDALEAEEITFVVLARYMQVLSPAFVQRYPNRIINIHHSFLPAFAGARPYHQAYERGVKVIGATAHYVTAGLDEGPVIEQDVARVSHRDSVEEMIQKGRDLEKVVLARAVKLHLSRRVLVYGHKTVVFD